jgi:UDP-N-acetylmuramyl pentapeptide phosphotransferase/UDP-N-acetylglucosamine-1-phosphate transferase
MITSHGIGEYALIAAIGFGVSMLVTARMIPLLRQKQFGQFIREEGPQAHLSKAGTPTMGGIAFIIGITVAILASMFMKGGDATGKIAILLSMLAFGAIGFIDDYNKVAKKQNEGLTPKQKLVLQLVFGLANVAWVPDMIGKILCVLFDYILPAVLGFGYELGRAGFVADDNIRPYALQVFCKLRDAAGFDFIQPEKLQHAEHGFGQQHIVMLALYLFVSI